MYVFEKLRSYMPKNAYFFIVNSRMIIRTLDEKAWHPLQENEVIFSKNYFSKILDRIFEKLTFCTKKCMLLFHY